MIQYLMSIFDTPYYMILNRIYVSSTIWDFQITSPHMYILYRAIHLTTKVTSVLALCYKLLATEFALTVSVISIDSTSYNFVALINLFSNIIFSFHFLDKYSNNKQNPKYPHRYKKDCWRFINPSNPSSNNHWKK